MIYKNYQNKKAQAISYLSLISQKIIMEEIIFSHRFLLFVPPQLLPQHSFRVGA